jgi:hypothetical protein
MPVIRRGGVQIGGPPNVGQPSTSPNIRSDLEGFDVPFDRDKFTKMIKSRGYDVTWEKATFCPFLKGPNPKDHDVNCRACTNGFLYYGLQTTRMLIMSLGLAQQYFAYGHFESGKAQITAYPEFKVSFWDRVTLVNSRARHTERVMRQRSTLRDKPKFKPLTVDHLCWAITDTTLGTAVQNTDFTVDTVTGEIVWVTNNRPGADVWYSLVYFFRPTYIVLDTSHHVRDQRIPLPNGTSDPQYEFPVQVVGQMDRFIRDEGRDPSNESDVANPFPTEGTHRWGGP